MLSATHYASGIEKKCVRASKRAREKNKANVEQCWLNVGKWNKNVIFFL